MGNSKYTDIKKDSAGVSPKITPKKVIINPNIDLPSVQIMSVNNSPTSLTKDNSLKWFIVMMLITTGLIFGLIITPTFDTYSNQINFYIDDSSVDGNGSFETPYGSFSDIDWTIIEKHVLDKKDVTINLKRGCIWKEPLIIYTFNILIMVPNKLQIIQQLVFQKSRMFIFLIYD